MRRVGIFAGTFDPVHQGHIGFCTAARQLCGLDEIVLIPEAQPRSKQQVSSLLHRTALLELATQAVPYLSVQVLRSQQFTIIETWPEIRRQFPDAHITLLIGADVAVDSLKYWQRLAEIIPEISFAVGLREGFALTDVQTAMHKLSTQLGVPIAYTVAHASYPEAASSQVRRGQLEYIANGAVARYIQQHGLYQHT